MKLRQKLKLETGRLEWPMKFNENTVVVKHLRSERPTEIALFAKEGRLLNKLHHENIVEIQGCYFSTCNFRPFGIEKKVNNLL